MSWLSDGQVARLYSNKISAEMLIMHRVIIFLSVTLCCFYSQANTIPISNSASISSPGHWGERDVWWNGRTSFFGQVIEPACTLSMDNIYQSINMGSTPVRDLQSAFEGPEKKFRLRLQNCELASVGNNVFTGSRVRVRFDGLTGETLDKFAVIGQAQGINLQIIDTHGYLARSGEPMPPVLLSGDEQELDYSLRVVRNGKPLKAGNYYAALRFRLDYE